MSLSRTVSEIKGDFARKSQTFSYPRLFNASLTGLSLEFCIAGRAQETRMMPPPKDLNVLAMCAFIRRDEQMDRRTDGLTEMIKQYFLPPACHLPSITHSLFHPRLKTHLFHKSSSIVC